MPLSILVHGKELGAKQGIKSDWRLGILTLVVKIGFPSYMALTFGYISVDTNLGRTFRI